MGKPDILKCVQKYSENKEVEMLFSMNSTEIFVDC